VWAFVDHGQDGTGEPLAFQLRAGNAGSNTAVDHIRVIRDALRQLPSHRPGTRPGRRFLIRTDAAGCTHDVLSTLAGQRLSYSVGFTLPDGAEQLIETIPASAWTPAYDRDGQARDGAWVAELTELLDLSSWPAGMRVIIRKERPHPGAQLRITDVDGHRVTAFANLPLHDFAQNQIWSAIVTLACELTAWMQMLALTGHQARRWEPKRLRLRIFSTAGRLTRSARRIVLRLAVHAPWAHLLLDAINNLYRLPGPAPG
jgi:hypothetical protein